LSLKKHTAPEQDQSSLSAAEHWLVQGLAVDFGATLLEWDMAIEECLHLSAVSVT